MQSPGLRGAQKWLASIANARCEEAAVLSRLVDRALATQHHALPVVATRFVDGCSLGDMEDTVTWHSGLFPCTSWRREVVGRSTSGAANWT